MTNCMGNTALHFTVEFGYLSLRDYLIKKGANIRIQNIKGQAPLEGIWKKIYAPDRNEPLDKSIKFPDLPKKEDPFDEILRKN